MKTTATRETAARREPRFSAPTRAIAPKPVQTEWAWPGLTRAQLRDHVIDMIG